MCIDGIIFFLSSPEIIMSKSVSSIHYLQCLSKYKYIIDI